MKTFQFRLQRVLEWRAAGVERRRLHVQSLLLELESISQRTEKIRGEMSLNASGVISGADLASFAQYRDRLIRELARLADRARTCREQLRIAQDELTRANRELKLLERLKEKQHEHWKKEFDRELENLASDVYLAKWPPSR